MKKVNLSKDKKYVLVFVVVFICFVVGFITGHAIATERDNTKQKIMSGLWCELTNEQSQLINDLIITLREYNKTDNNIDLIDEIDCFDLQTS